MIFESEIYHFGIVIYFVLGPRHKKGKMVALGQKNVYANEWLL